MKILIASNSFKESLTSFQANNAIKKGILLYKSLYRKDISIKQVEICDGGTGFASILAHECGGKVVYTKSVDPLLRKINSSYGVSSDGKDIYIEVANTAGLALLSRDQRNPVNTSSYGVGLQIIDAIRNHQPRRIFIGCGDTAINDFGIGMISALGLEFIDSKGDVFKPKTPQDIFSISHFNFPSSKYIKYLLNGCEVVVCCNLSSQLGGSKGTTEVYARQKGASDTDIQILQKAKDHYLNLTRDFFEIDISLIPGSGAAGGVGGSLYLFCSAYLTYSFEYIFDLIGLEGKIEQSDLVITGEGLLDKNSLKGKAPIGVALFAKKHDKKVALISGAVQQFCTNILHRAGVDYVESITHPSIDLEFYLDSAESLVADASFRLMQKISP